jgi:hypothetical protein
MTQLSPIESRTQGSSRPPVQMFSSERPLRKSANSQQSSRRGSGARAMKSRSTRPRFLSLSLRVRTAGTSQRLRPKISRSHKSKRSSRCLAWQTRNPARKRRRFSSRHLADLSLRTDLNRRASLKSRPRQSLRLSRPSVCRGRQMRRRTPFTSRSSRRRFRRTSVLFLTTMRTTLSD